MHLLVTVFGLSRYRRWCCTSCITTLTVMQEMALGQQSLVLCITALTMMLTGDAVGATVSLVLLEFVTVFSVTDPPSNPSLALRFHHPSHLLSLVCWPKWWGFMPGTVAKATHERKRACFPKKEWKKSFPYHRCTRV